METKIGLHFLCFLLHLLSQTLTMAFYDVQLHRQSHRSAACIPWRVETFCVSNEHLTVSWLFSTITFDSFLSLIWRLWFVKCLSPVQREGGTFCSSLPGGGCALVWKTFRHQRWQRKPLDFSLFNLVAVCVCKDYQQTETGIKFRKR